LSIQRKKIIQKSFFRRKSSVFQQKVLLNAPLYAIALVIHFKKNFMASTETVTTSTGISMDTEATQSSGFTDPRTATDD
jgi:hypothetical protein